MPCPQTSSDPTFISQRRALQNLAAVLAEAGSSFDNVVKVNIFITTMDNFAKMNEAWDEFFTAEVKPVSQHGCLLSDCAKRQWGHRSIGGKLTEEWTIVPHLRCRVPVALQCVGRD